MNIKEKKPATRDTSDRIPTYNPALPNIHTLQETTRIQQSTERVRNLFQEVPVVTFRRSGTNWPTCSRETRKQWQHTQAPCWHIPLQLQTWPAASPAHTLTMENIIHFHQYRRNKTNWTSHILIMKHRACEAREKIFSASPHSRSPFSASFDCLRVRTWISKNTDCFAV